ncbi:hypothetical protein [Paenibacillus paeoniae]|uniref:Uncharacterized protein n=1 Tax=Paenibacillus paeoniae TaxID=2292705 RepID=A0A371PK95_9BACL|nr:hypothetical protein [Paenibacillus paeoniae]REK76089.1 hypothetical protein DX130_03210 [Paenibacillus paeoniae]
MNKLAGMSALLGGLPFVALSKMNGEWNVVTLGAGVIFATVAYAGTAKLSKLRQRRDEARREEQTVRQEQLATWRLEMEQRLEQQRQQMEAGLSALTQGFEVLGARIDKQTEAALSALTQGFEVLGARMDKQAEAGLSVLTQGFETLGARMDKQTEAGFSAMTQGFEALGARMDKQTEASLSAMTAGFESLGARMDKQTEVGLSALIQGFEDLGAKMDKQTDAFRVLGEVSRNLSSLREISESLEKSHEAWITASERDRANLEQQTGALMDALVQTTENKQAVRERLVQLQERMLSKLVK